MLFSVHKGKRGHRLPLPLLAAAAATATALLLAACGGSDGRGTTAGDSKTLGAEPSGGAVESAAPASAAAASGTPIKTMTLSAVDYNGPTYENIQIGAKLFAKYINAKGGINGHPLEVLTCDDKGDPAQTTSCVRKAIEAGVVADVGSFSFNAAVAVPPYAKAGTAIFGTCCNLTPLEYKTPNTFQMGNNPALNPAGVAKAVQDGCKKIGVLELDLPGITEEVNVLFQNVAKAYGYTGKLKLVKVPLTTQDYSSQVAQATDGTDCISMFLSESNISGVMPAFAQSGGKQRLYGPQGNFDKVSIKGFENLPGVKNGVVYGAYPPLANPVWDDFRATLKKYNASTKQEYNSLGALGVWAAYTAFTQIASGITGEVTNKTFLEAASKAKVDTGGMTPALDFSQTWDGLGGKYARAFSRQATYYKVTDNSQVGDKVFTDLTDALEGKPAS